MTTINILVNGTLAIIVLLTIASVVGYLRRENK